MKVSAVKSHRCILSKQDEREVNRIVLRKEVSSKLIGKKVLKPRKAGVNYTMSKLCQGQASSPLEMVLGCLQRILGMKNIIFKTVLSVYKNKDILKALKHTLIINVSNMLKN